MFLTFIITLEKPIDNCSLILGVLALTASLGNLCRWARDTSGLPVKVTIVDLLSAFGLSVELLASGLVVKTTVSFVGNLVSNDVD